MVPYLKKTSKGQEKKTSTGHHVRPKVTKGSVGRGLNLSTEMCVRPETSSKKKKKKKKKKKGEKEEEEKEEKEEEEEEEEKEEKKNKNKKKEN
ncbi:hypothetical protein M8J76_013939 [Diaphorina citri]|nr:hypothetical protein M8J76_013939 [Diaphorina citri]